MGARFYLCPIGADPSLRSGRLISSSLLFSGKIVADQEGVPMGFSFRKSIGLGPFRVNLSKSGVGLSTGVKGARISTGPHGTRVYGGWGPFRYQKSVGPGMIPGVEPRGKPRGAWGVGTVLMLIIVVSVWAYTKYYKPIKAAEKTTAAPASVHKSKSHKAKAAVRKSE